jgi:hypothetical protein
MGAILALLTGPAVVAAAVGAGPVRAHSCSLPVRFEAGKPGAVTIGALAEERAVTQVDVSIPKGFTVIDLAPARGWKGERTDGGIRYSGGTIDAFTCAYFTVNGEVAKKGIYQFDLTTKLDNGEVRRFTQRDPSSPSAAQLVLVGVEPDLTELAGDKGGGGSRNWMAGVAAAVAGAGGVFGLRAVVRRARGRRTPAA